MSMFFGSKCFTIGKWRHSAIHRDVSLYRSFPKIKPTGLNSENAQLMPRSSGIAWQQRNILPTTFTKHIWLFKHSARPCDLSHAVYCKSRNSCFFMLFVAKIHSTNANIGQIHGLNFGKWLCNRKNICTKFKPRGLISKKNPNLSPWGLNSGGGLIFGKLR